MKLLDIKQKLKTIVFCFIALKMVRRVETLLETLSSCNDSASDDSASDVEIREDDGTIDPLPSRLEKHNRLLTYKLPLTT